MLNIKERKQNTEVQAPRELQRERTLVLVIDRSWKTREDLEVGLSKNGFDVLTSDSLENSQILNANFDPDVIIADPSGIDTDNKAGHIRKMGRPYIIMQNVNSDDVPIKTVTSLNNGADFFLPKPINSNFLAAHIRASLRTREEKPDLDTVWIGDLRIDLRGGLLSRQDKDIQLTNTEINILRVLLRERGKIIPSGMILRDACGKEYQDDEQYLRVWISRVRRGLQELGAEELLETENGVGYMFLAESPQALESLIRESEFVISPDIRQKGDDERMNILALDRDFSNLGLLRYSLPNSQYRLRTASSIPEAEEILENFSVDMILAGDGFLIIPNEKQTCVSWIAMLKNDASGPKILDLGADNFVKKPLSIQILTLKMKAIERRKREGYYMEPKREEIILGRNGVKVDLGNRKAFIFNEEGHFTATEWKILALLAENHGNIVSRSDLLEAISKNGGRKKDNNITVWINRIRKKIGDVSEDQEPQAIITVGGFGYIFQKQEKSKMKS